MAKPLPKIAVIWAQFGPYHVDRCAALARRFAGRAEIIAVEIATASRDYAWKPSGEVPGARKITLFPGRIVEDVPRWRRLLAMWRALRGCETVLFGIGYGLIEGVVLAWLLRLSGCRVVLMTDSKYDDKPRSTWFEAVKCFALLGYSSAIVAGSRQIDYVRSLGFRRRAVLPCYDGVGTDRIRDEAGAPPAPDGLPFAERHFLFIGRFVAKKNLDMMLRGYADYVSRSGTAARRLQLVGGGELEPQLHALAESLEIAGKVDFLGFLDSKEVNRRLARALAIVLVSTEEQWGLVINEALALGLPAVVSTPVGARDLLVRDHVNGRIIDPADSRVLGAALSDIAADEQAWRRMCQASREMSWLGDCDRFVDSVEVLLDPQAQGAADNVARVLAALA